MKRFATLVLALTAASVFVPAPSAVAAGCVIDDIVEDLPRCVIYGSPPVYQTCVKLGLC